MGPLIVEAVLAYLQSTPGSLAQSAESLEGGSHEDFDRDRIPER